jgi:hypothetical protein
VVSERVGAMVFGLLWENAVVGVGRGDGAGMLL